MQSEGDLIADRKRLKGRLGLWRAIAIIAVFGAGIALGGVKNLNKEGRVLSTGYIARVTVDGIMMDDEKRDELLEEIRDDKRVKALIVRFNSPGGTTVGGEELYLQLRKVAEKKPVVGTMRTICASACYMASLGTDHTVAREGTLTGSIGVLLQSMEVSRLADKLGITPITIKSGKYKDVPSLTDPFTEEERVVVKEVVDDAYRYFTGLIVKRRNMTEEQVRELADGRVYTGHQAVQLNLVDGLGGQQEALAWLAQTHKIDPELEVKDLKPEPELDSLFGKLSQWTHINIFDSLTVGLDGLVSMWQPSSVQ